MSRTIRKPLPDTLALGQPCRNVTRATDPASHTVPRGSHRSLQTLPVQDGRTTPRPGLEITLKIRGKSFANSADRDRPRPAR
jgi:hypothetical protein